jgi:hypothetical protein
VSGENGGGNWDRPVHGDRGGDRGGILVLLDRLTLRPGLSSEERKEILAKRSQRWQRRWWNFYVCMAVIALVVNGLNLSHENLRSRLGWSIPAAVVVIFFLLSRNSTGRNQEDEDQE